MQTTGWPPGMLQDDSRELSRWLSTRLGARYQLQRNNMQTNQTPDALAKVLTNQLQLCIDDPMWANHFEMHKDTARLFIRNITRLRDMAVSGAKDAERYQLLKEKSRGAMPMVRVLIIERGQYIHHVNPDERLDAIAATKRGGA